jgi:large subunit ribosomal protein L6
MSRIGKQPIPVPDGVDVEVQKQTVTVKGKNGELTWTHHKNLSVEYDKDGRRIRVLRPSDTRENRALHGLTRSLINNMVKGVVEPFEKRLEIVGVGYNAVLNGRNLQLQVGYANTVVLPVPKAVTCELPDNTHIVLKSADKQAVGQFAAEIRSVRPPEPYKGKGIRYQGEQVRRKAGKALASGS